MTYWHYTYIKNRIFHRDIQFGWGVMSSCTEFPDFSGIYKVYPALAILSVTEIDADQAAALTEMIEKKENER